MLRDEYKREKENARRELLLDLPNPSLSLRGGARAKVGKTDKNEAKSLDQKRRLRGAHQTPAVKSTLQLHDGNARWRGASGKVAQRKTAKERRMMRRMMRDIDQAG